MKHPLFMKWRKRSVKTVISAEDLLPSVPLQPLSAFLTGSSHKMIHTHFCAQDHCYHQLLLSAQPTDQQKHSGPTHKLQDLSVSAVPQENSLSIPPFPSPPTLTPTPGC